MASFPVLQIILKSQSSRASARATPDLLQRQDATATEKFHQVGRYSPAMALMSDPDSVSSLAPARRYAGFEEDTEAEVVVFKGDSTQKAFQRVLEANALHGQLQCQALRDAVPEEDSTAKPAKPQHGGARTGRHHIAALTELRLKEKSSQKLELFSQDPRAFAEARKNRGNRGVGGTIPKPYAPVTTSRRSQARYAQSTFLQAVSCQHFTVSDLEKMRVEEEIAGMPSYAEECAAKMKLK